MSKKSDESGAGGGQGATLRRGNHGEDVDTVEWPIAITSTRFPTELPTGLEVFVVPASPVQVAAKREAEELARRIGHKLVDRLPVEHLIGMVAEFGGRESDELEDGLKRIEEGAAE